MKLFFAILFFVAVIIELSAHVLDTGLNAHSKPLLMPLLLIYFIASYGLRLDRKLGLVALALLLSCAGDISLMGQGANRFIAGLSFFLLAHLIYIFIFIRNAETGDFAFRLNWKLILPIFVYCIGLMSLLLPGSGPMLAPIILYGLTILTMWYAAAVSFGLRATHQNWQVIIGATLFVISDSMIGLNRFYTELPQSGFLIMSTYIGGQFFIVNGLLSYFKASKQPTITQTQSI